MNPGLLLLTAGVDLELTPKLKAIVNASFLRFHKAGALESLLFQPGIRKGIGIDLGGGVLFRPFLNENVVIQAGLRRHGQHALQRVPGPEAHLLGGTGCSPRDARFWPWRCSGFR